MWVSSAETGVGDPLAPDRSSMISTVIAQVAKWVESWIYIELGWYVARSGKGRRLEPDGRGGCPVAQVMVVQHSADRGGPGPQAARP